MSALFRSYLCGRKAAEWLINMAEKTEAQKRAQKNYMDKFAVARVRMDREKYDLVQAHAAAHGQSVNGFINEAIDEKMERDKEKAGE